MIKGALVHRPISTLISFCNLRSLHQPRSRENVMSALITQPAEAQSKTKFDVRRIREDFPILKTTVSGKPLIYLDNGATPNPDVHFVPDIYTIDRKSAQTKILIEFELAAILDQQGKVIPARQIIASRRLPISWRRSRKSKSASTRSFQIPTTNVPGRSLSRLSRTGM